MQYELQTTLGVALEGHENIEEVRSRVYRAVEAAAAMPDFGQVEAFKVTLGDRENELIVGLLFHAGVRAQYIEEIGTDFLNAATALYLAGAGNTEVSEESVRLQSVFA